MTWKSLNIYLHNTKIHNEFILNELEPLLHFNKANYGIQHSFILKHWRKGFHLQLHIGFHEKIDNDTITTKLQEMEHALLKNISKYRLDIPLNQEQMEKMYKNLQIFELESGELYPIENDVSIKITNSILREDIWGNKGVKIIREYYSETNKFTLDILKQPSKNKYINSFLLMHAAIQALGNSSRHQLSYRSHAEAFLNRFDKNDILRNQFEQQYTINRPSIEKLLHSNIEDNPIYKDWHQYFCDFIVKNKNLMEQGIIDVPESPTFKKIIETNGWDPGLEESISDFHKHLNQLSTTNKKRKSTLFKMKRLILNCLYLTFVQIGIKPTEKFMLCYSISRWYEEVLGQNWMIQLNKQSAKEKIELLNDGL